jgi:hypothetical protein
MSYKKFNLTNLILIIIFYLFLKGVKQAGYIIIYYYRPVYIKIK